MLEAFIFGRDRCVDNDKTKEEKVTNNGDFKTSTQETNLEHADNLNYGLKLCSEKVLVRGIEHF